MNKDPAGKSAPSGGFQNLGWYSGYQYYNGSFAPSAGVIHPNSPQAGAGQAVSAEVNAQSAAQQGVSPEQFQNYINQQNQTYTPQPSSSGPVNRGPASTSSTSSSGPGVTFQAPAAINLPEMYKGLYDNSGITDLESQLSAKEKAYNDTIASIKDNPYLSEANMTGRIRKIDDKFAADNASLKNDIAVKKADIETKLNLEMKQFDINSQQTQLAWQQFNTLLAAGALDNASGESIANITRATGISSDMIYSAIDANKKKNVKSSVIQSTADSGEVTVSVINTDTGEIIKQTSLGMIGNAQTGSKPSQQELKTQYVDWAKADAQNGKTLNDMMAYYAGYLTPEEIYNLYSAIDYYHATTAQQITDKQKYNIK